MTKALFDFTGKVVLVTGGSRGLGKEMVMAFAERGADVIVASRKLEACEAVADEARKLGPRALGIAVHVGKWNELETLTETAYKEFGRVDVLINCAGVSPIAPSLVEVTEALFDKINDVNFKGPFRLSTLIGTRMAKGNGGCIINVSSIGALLPSPYFGPYSGAKAALNAVSIALAMEYAPNVRVNVISPGGFLTDISGDWANDSEATKGVMLGRFARPQEIVTTALYLASDYSSFTTAANIRVDGGCIAVKTK